VYHKNMERKFACNDQYFTLEACAHSISTHVRFAHVPLCHAYIIVRSANMRDYCTGIRHSTSPETQGYDALR
jgi:hypothetical protein